MPHPYGGRPSPRARGRVTAASVGGPRCGPRFFSVPPPPQISPPHPPLGTRQLAFGHGARALAFGHGARARRLDTAFGHGARARRSDMAPGHWRLDVAPKSSRGDPPPDMQHLAPVGVDFVPGHQRGTIGR